MAPAVSSSPAIANADNYSNGMQDPSDVELDRKTENNEGGTNSMAARGDDISLEILSTVKSAQGAHGLKHGDFIRYSQYCSRRLRRVRRATHLTQGRGRFVPRQVVSDDVHRNANALLVPLTEAERAWAIAMAVKRAPATTNGGMPAAGMTNGGNAPITTTTTTTATGQGAGSFGDRVLRPGERRRLVISKLVRAVQASERLRTLCEQAADEHTVLEAEAYAKWMAATLDLEREDWGRALAAFEVVARVYEGMVAVCAGTPAAGIFEERVDEVATAIRFCRYNLARSGQGGGDEEELLRGFRESASGTSDNMLSQKIEAILSDARRKAAQNLGQVEWCGTVVPIRSERIREAILLADEKSKELRKKLAEATSIDAFDAVFIAYNDAILIVNKELAEFRQATTSRSEEHISQLESLIAYLTHGRVSHTIERNLLLVDSFKAKRSSKPEDFVRLYDNLIQNQTDILGLAGVETDAAVFNRAESQRTVFKVHRCFHLAECYRVADMLKEADVLYDRVRQLARPLTGVYSVEANKIVNQSRCMKSRVRAAEFIKQASIADDMSALRLSPPDSALSKVGEKALMIDHLDAFLSFADDSSGMRAIVDMPPVLEAVPCKPVMFDLAIDGVDFPLRRVDREERELQLAGESVKFVNQESDSSSSYFSRWWSSSAKK